MPLILDCNSSSAGRLEARLSPSSSLAQNRYLRIETNCYMSHMRWHSWAVIRRLKLLTFPCHVTSILSPTSLMYQDFLSCTVLDCLFYFCIFHLGIYKADLQSCNSRIV